MLEIETLEQSNNVQVSNLLIAFTELTTAHRSQIVILHSLTASVFCPRSVVPVLYCTVLFNVLYCIMYCTVLYCTVLYCTVLLFCTHSLCVQSSLRGSWPRLLTASTRRYQGSTRLGNL